MLLAASFALSGCGRTTIDLNDYLTYKFTGVNGYGEISYTIQSDAIVDDHPKAFELSGNNEELLSDIGAYLDAENLNGSWDKSKDLSNGDDVVFTWDESTISALEEEYKVKFKDDEIQATVDGLEKVEQYDAFQGLEVSFEGYAPGGRVDIDASDCEIDSLKYTAKPSENLKNGDKVTVTVAVPDDCAKTYGKVPKETSKEYTVSGLDGFVTTAADIPEDTMNAMKKQAEDTLKAWFASTSREEEKMDGMTYVGNYFLTPKDSSDVGVGWSSKSGNGIFLIYKTDYTADGKSVSGYWYCCFTDIKILADGTYSVDTTAYQTPSTSRNKIQTGIYYYPGFPDLTSLFNHCVTENAETYNYEDNVGTGSGETT